MNVTVISEYGMEEALLGLGLSFGKTTGNSHLHVRHEEALYTPLLGRAAKLSGLGGGHDKFLRMLMVTLDITAPLYWWKEFDTYKVGTVVQSESTMHTLMQNKIVPEMFEGRLSDALCVFLDKWREEGDFEMLNKHLPHSFLQRRIVMTNYAVIQNILEQRKGHKLPEWKLFCARAIAGCRHTSVLCPSHSGENANA